MEKQKISFLDKIKNIIPGVILTASVAALSIYLSDFITLGSVAIAILIGFIINNLPISKSTIFNEGISFSEKTLLSIAIVFLGSYMDVGVLSYISINNIALIILIILASILFCYAFGRLFGLSHHLSILLGIGNGICGSSAIAGASKILDTDENEVGISIAIVNALGAISIFVIPGILLSFFSEFSNKEMGFVVGSTIQAFGQVTAAGFLINQEVGEYAIIIKMIRIVMLGPALVVLTFLVSNKIKNKKSDVFSTPYFIIGFIILSILTSLNFIPDIMTISFQKASKVLLVIAMAGIGLKISVRSIFKFGQKSLFVSTLAYSVQIFFVITLIIFLF